MNKKIIIIISFVSLGGAIILLPFSRKESSPKKVEINKNPENNQYLDHPKKKKPSLLKIAFQISGIIIVILIIIFIIRLFLEKLWYDSYFQGSLYLVPQNDHIEIYFCTQRHSPEEEQLPQKLYNLDININNNALNIPPDVQKIYQGLQTEQNKEFLLKLGKLFATFFNLLNGYLLATFFHYYDSDDYTTVKLIENLCRRYNFFRQHRSPIKVMNIDIKKNIKDGEYQAQKIKITGNENARNFFQKAMGNDELFYYQTDNQENYFFKYYYLIYNNFIKEITDDLSDFFENNATYKTKYAPDWQKIQKVNKEIEQMLGQQQ